MAFTPQQREDFISFLRSMDKNVASKLPAKEAGELFATLIDYTVDEDAFELKIAKVFYKVPHLFNDLKDSIKNISIVRNAMLDEGDNAQEAKDLTLDFFVEHIDDFFELASHEEMEEEHELTAAERARRIESKADKLRMEKQLAKLQLERQQIFEAEKSERQRRKEEKKSTEVKIRQIRQQEYDEAAEQRKEEKRQLEEQIAILQKDLQLQHDKEVDDRKERQVQKEALAKKLQEEQERERDKQSVIRIQEKVQQQEFMRVRQAEIALAQEKQREERLVKKKSEEEAMNKAISALRDEQSRERAAKKNKILPGMMPPAVDMRSGGNGDD
jgi:hypothetical protein